MNIIDRILQIKRKRNAVILAHNYQLPEVQDIADYAGDSLELSIKAANTKADVIAFCGVYFMAETAKILSPQKTVLIPDKEAGCPMADMIEAEDLRRLKGEHPNAKVLCYVNTTADVKAECDICCTSANAAVVATEFFKDQQDVIFVPDKYLAFHTSQQTGKKFIFWQGFCPTHAGISPSEIQGQKRLHPEAKVIVHPECIPGVTSLADEVLSTGGMCRYAKETRAQEVIVGTEIGILHRLKKENPEKKFYAAFSTVCPNMKRITLEKLLWSLEEMSYEVTLAEETLLRSSNSIEQMLNFGSDKNQPGRRRISREG